MPSSRQAATQGLVSWSEKRVTITPRHALSKQPAQSGQEAALQLSFGDPLWPTWSVLWQGAGSATGIPKGTEPQAGSLCASPSGPGAFPWGAGSHPCHGAGAAALYPPPDGRFQAARCFLLLWLLSSEVKLWLEILCCFGGRGYFSTKIKEMDLLTQGSGRQSNSCFLIFAFVASIPACCCWPHSSWLQTPAGAKARLGCPPCEPLPSASHGHGTFSPLLFGHWWSALAG